MTRKFVCGCGCAWEKPFKPLSSFTCPNCGSKAQVRECTPKGNVVPLEMRPTHAAQEINTDTERGR